MAATSFFGGEFFGGEFFNTPEAAAATISGVRKGAPTRRPYRVRRADFSSQANYELALRAALLNANFAVSEADDAPVTKREPTKARPAPRIAVTDTAIKLSAGSLAALQHAAEMDEVEMLKFFIDVIESEWP